MATQPTQEAVPSESPRNLKFNAGKIDEFVNSSSHSYIDRFGKSHFTIAYINYSAAKLIKSIDTEARQVIDDIEDSGKRAVAGLGYITLDSFQDGNTITLSNQILRWTKPDGDGAYYRWDGALPKTVPAGSTPGTAGGEGLGKWLCVGDDALRSNLASSGGASIVSTDSGLSLQRYATAQEDRAIFITDPPYNCVGDWDGNTGTDNWAGIQRALDDLPSGGTLFIPNGQIGAFAISRALRITKAVTIQGGGRGIFRHAESQIQRGIVQMTPSEDVFTLVASQDQWMFGQYGILDVHFKDIQIGGRSLTSLCTRGVGVDTTVNGGDFHIRECTFSSVLFKYCRVPVEFVGIAYLNSFHQCAFAWSGSGVSINRGAAPDVGGQTRFTLCTFDMITSNCLSLNLDSPGAGGDFYIAGCTFADSHGGIDINEEASVVVHACHFENLKQGRESTSGFGLRFHITSPDNPSSQAIKSVVDNTFFDNDRSIIINKTTEAFSGGGLNWPMRIDGNVFLDPIALEIIQPSGHVGINSQQFVFGASNTGLDNGKMLDSQISPYFYGLDQRRQFIKRRYIFGEGLNNKYLFPGGMVVTKARMYLTSHATSFTQLNFGDGLNNGRYMTVDATTQPLNTWVNWEETVPQTIITSQLMSFEIYGTAGFKGAKGVFEIEGYIP